LLGLFPYSESPSSPEGSSFQRTAGTLICESLVLLMDVRSCISLINKHSISSNFFISHLFCVTLVSVRDLLRKDLHQLEYRLVNLLLLADQLKPLYHSVSHGQSLYIVLLNLSVLVEPNMDKMADLGAPIAPVSSALSSSIKARAYLNLLTILSIASALKS
jgi:hypothetical protein